MEEFPKRQCLGEPGSAFRRKHFLIHQDTATHMPSWLDVERAFTDIQRMDASIPHDFATVSYDAAAPAPIPGIEIVMFRLNKVPNLRIGGDGPQ